MKGIALALVFALVASTLSAQECAINSAELCPMWIELSDRYEFQYQNTLDNYLQCRDDLANLTRSCDANQACEQLSSDYSKLQTEFFDCKIELKTCETLYYQAVKDQTQGTEECKEKYITLLKDYEDLYAVTYQIATECDKRTELLIKAVKALKAQIRALKRKGSRRARRH